MAKNGVSRLHLYICMMGNLRTLTLLTTFVTAFIGLGCDRAKVTHHTAKSQSVLSVTASATSLPPNGTATITATGGTGQYINAITSSGTLQQTGNGTYNFIAPSVVPPSGFVTISVIDSSNALASVNIQIGDSNSSTLQIFANSSSVALGGSITLSAVGGAAPYTWQVSAGASLSANSGASVTLYGQALGYVTVTLTDSTGKSVSGTVQVIQAVSCSGYYSVNAQPGRVGTLFIQPAGNGQFTGTLQYQGSSARSLTGVCSGNSIQFQLSTGEIYLGTFYYTTLDPTSPSIVGTYPGGQWVAVANN